ncbi:MAG TPA: hypothetical protein VHU23_02900 [Rhizomicrobium sp.]|nr:hypothetical protein [Rhizomicrobium sp.]
MGVRAYRWLAVKQQRRGKVPFRQQGNAELRNSGPASVFTCEIYDLRKFRRLMSDPKSIPASEFTRNFGRYRMRAQREPVPVSSHGRITGYFVAPDEYEELKRFRESRHSFATEELPAEKVKAIASARMDKRHQNLDALLDRK